MFQTTPLFAVPLVETQHPDPTALNQELRELFLAREAEGHRYANRHATMAIKRGLFESDFTVFSWPERPIQQLREFCWSALSRAIAELNQLGPKEIQAIRIASHTWFHITRYGGQFDLHNHPMASWSGVYCVDPGDFDPDNPDSGALTFINPSGMAHMFVDVANNHLRRPYTPTNFGYRLQPGRLVLFPSWVGHMVQPYWGQRERITVAFNCWFEMTQLTR